MSSMLRCDVLNAGLPRLVRSIKWDASALCGKIKSSDRGIAVDDKTPEFLDPKDGLDRRCVA